MADAVRRLAAVLGGGPSLPDDLFRIPRGTTLISVNHHALKLCEPHFMAYMDDPEKVPELKAALETYRGRVINPKPHLSDIPLPKGEMWDGGFTSTFATWFALWSGFDEVVLCGMDLYQGERKYFYERTGFYHPVFDYPLENHLRAWRLAFKHCPHPERIRAMSGPLIDIFGAFDG